MWIRAQCFTSFLETKNNRNGGMYSEDTTCLFFLLMFYFEFTHGLHKNSETGSTSQASCNAKDECILLRDCRSYMDFIEIAEKPLKPPVVAFLRGKQCGFLEGYPKVCCSVDSKDGIFTTSSPKPDYKNCPMKSNCVLLKDCKPYMDLIGSMDKPLKSLVVEFLRAQQCGFQEGYPTVCCSLIPKNLKTLKHARPNSRPHPSMEQNKLSTELDIKNIFSHMQTTTHKSPKSSHSERIKEKAAAINKAFDLSDFFDFTGSFDLLRKKRFDDGSKLNVEIR